MKQNLTKEQKEVLDEISTDDIINYLGEDEILDYFTPNEIASYYTLEDILDCYTDYDIAHYLNNNGYDFFELSECNENTFDKFSNEDLLIEFCRRFEPHSVLTKEDIREIINNHNDDMVNKTYN